MDLAYRRVYGYVIGNKPLAQSRIKLQHILLQKNAMNSKDLKLFFANFVAILTAANCGEQSRLRICDLIICSDHVPRAGSTGLARKCTLLKRETQRWYTCER